MPEGGRLSGAGEAGVGLLVLEQGVAAEGGDAPVDGRHQRVADHLEGHAVPGARLELLGLLEEDHRLVRAIVVMVVALHPEDRRGDQHARDVFLRVVDAQRDGLGAVQAELEGGDEVAQLLRQPADGAVVVRGDFLDPEAFRRPFPLPFGEFPFGGLAFLEQGVGDQFLVRLGEQGGGGFGRDGGGAGGEDRE